MYMGGLKRNRDRVNSGGRKGLATMGSSEGTDEVVSTKFPFFFFLSCSILYNWIKVLTRSRSQL